MQAKQKRRAAPLRAGDGKKRGNPALIKLIAILLLVAIAFWGLYCKFSPVVLSSAEYYIKVLASRQVNDAILKEMNDEQLDYQNIVTISRGSNNEITAIETDVVKINHLKASVTEKVMDSLYDMQGADMSIPLGTLLGSKLFTGRGPGVKFRIVPGTYVNATFSNHFDSVGINQTRHQIYLNISVDIIAFLPGFQAPITVTSDICVAETVIVGKIPEGFADLDLGSLTGSKVQSGKTGEESK